MTESTRPALLRPRAQSPSALLNLLDERHDRRWPDISVDPFVRADHLDHLVDHVLRIELPLQERREARANVALLREMHSIVVPVIGRVCKPIIESRVVRARIDRLNGDPARRDLIAQRGRDSFQGMLACAIRTETVGGEHSTHRADEQDAASRLRLEELANDALCDGEARKDVRLEHATNDVDRHLREGAALSDASVAQERVEGPAHRVRDVAIVENVQLVDDERVAEAELLDLPPQIGRLRPKLSRREHAMSGLRESDGASPAQTATRSRDQYAFHGLIPKCWRFG